MISIDLKFMRWTLILLGMVGLTLSAQEPRIPFNPRHYICYRTDMPLSIDGLMNEPSWQNSAWTEDFEDIEGSFKPKPIYRTRAKMLWDTNYLYIGAFLEEPHVWGTLRERESVIFYDPDFEVFIDPDGDTHLYAEFEMNALNTQWDLLLLKPYRDDLLKNVAIDHWNFNGIRTAVYVDGTLNDPTDTDKGWSIEIAIPLDALVELGSSGQKPVNGEQYRINFSRVEWHVDIVNGKYRKKTRRVNGLEKNLPEENWVWSPQGVVAMHQPETWGFLQFSERLAGTGLDAYVEDPDHGTRWALRMLYYRQKAWFDKHGKYTDNIADLELPLEILNILGSQLVIEVKKNQFESSVPSVKGGGVLHIREDGKIWK